MLHDKHTQSNRRSANAKEDEDVNGVAFQFAESGAHYVPRKVVHSKRLSANVEHVNRLTFQFVEWPTRRKYEKPHKAKELSANARQHVSRLAFRFVESGLHNGTRKAAHSKILSANVERVHDYRHRGRYEL